MPPSTTFPLPPLPLPPLPLPHLPLPLCPSSQDTFYTQDTSSTVTLALLFIMDTIIFYWIFTSLVATRRALRLRKNYVKLSLYNHFVYTLIFAIIGWSSLPSPLRVLHLFSSSSLSLSHTHTHTRPVFL